MPQSSVFSNLRAKLKSANRRLLVAMACYLVLILIALYGLLPVHNSNDGFVLGFVLLVLTLLIVKTLAHAEDDKTE